MYIQYIGAADYIEYMLDKICAYHHMKEYP